ncbi:MAG: YgfZ/GcvT domain-containing protein, partial [Gammaproteobacteria bacterium]
MDSRWQAFLEDAGAVIADGVVSHFGNPRREIRIGTTGNVLCDLSQQGLITASGDDAMAFLQGQLSNDISQVDSRHSQLSGYCNPQGRLLAILRIFIRDNLYHLELPRSLLDDTLERLRKFVLMSKVKLEDGGDCLVRMGYSGPDSEAELAPLVGGAVPSQVNEVRCTEELTVIRVPGPVPRFVIYGKPPAMEKLWSALDVRAAPVGRQVWERLDILAGLPLVLPETAEAFI